MSVTNTRDNFVPEIQIEEAAENQGKRRVLFQYNCFAKKKIKKMQETKTFFSGIEIMWMQTCQRQRIGAWSRMCLWVLICSNQIFLLSKRRVFPATVGG